MKTYITHCHYSDGRVVKFRTQVASDIRIEDLKPNAYAIAFTFTKKMPEKIEFVACPIQGC
ncbi:MAG: hypothetical protein J6A37_06975 [Oscillospiraceae bacterium]|nr:hypothetical protein [Oscillospiraceae bacterium]